MAKRIDKHYKSWVALAAAVLLSTACHRSQQDDHKGGAGASSGAPPGAASAGGPSAPPPLVPVAPSLNDSDRDFLMKAAQSGLLEVDAGQLAESHAGSRQVREFGERMVTDHSMADNALAAIAQKDQVGLPTELRPDDQTRLDRLKTLTGRPFDREYAHLMVEDHRAAVRDFESGAETLSDPELRIFAANTLPTLRTHLLLAEALPGLRTR